MFNHLVGQNLDRYRIIRRIAEDRLGVVFKAHDPSLQRDVAIRVINPSIVNQPDFVENFMQAARVAARLDHPNIVQVFDSGESNGMRYIVMEYIPGGTLEQLLEDLRRNGRWILLEEAVQIIRQLAMALEYLRSQGVPQRTVKSSNVMIKPVHSERLPYMPVLTSLGLARLIEGGLGDPSVVDPAYLSPEGALDRTTDARSDVYTLGVLLFELSTGQLPFPIQTLDDAVRYHVRQPLPPPRSIRPDLPEALEQVIARALEKNPAGRFPDPATMANELERITPVVARVSSAPPTLESAVSLLVPYRRSVAEAAAGAPDEERHAARVEGLVSPQTTQVSTVQATAGPRRVEVVLEKAQLSIEPGNNGALTAIVLNTGSTESYFTVTLEGIPPSWIPMTSQVVQLKPGERQDVRFTIQPPRSPQSRAGRYPLTVRAVSQQVPGQSAEAKATLTVAAFAHFTSGLQSARLNSGEVGQVTVNNLGNTPETFTLSFRDPEGALAFRPPQAQLRLSEGQAGIAEFQPGLRQPRLIGGERSHPFAALITSTTGETQTHSGEMMSYPLVPTWLLGLLLVLFLCSAGAIVLFLSSTGLRASQATQQAIANQTGTVAELQSTFDAGTATALFLSDANEATIQAVTATAVWLEADDDTDGLTNRREIELGTNPSQADTDGDGLSDGDEVNRKTDPLKPDTDGDGIPDGQEASQNLDPLNQDTDGDGLIDSQDPNPLQTSTPSPNPAATAQAMATQTAAAIQATQAAAGQQATQAAAQAAAATATAQAAAAAATAGANATAAAIATANAAGTAQVAATQTTAAGQLAATQTANAAQRLAYIYQSDTTLAGHYQNLMQTNGFVVDLVPQNAIGGTDFGPYRAILIGPDTGAEENWGDEEGAQVNRLLDAGKPILGLGQGGYAFFGRADLVIGYDNGVTGEGTDINIVNPTSPIWTTPNRINIPGNQVITLYSSPSPFVAIDESIPPLDITLIGRQPGDVVHYTLIQQGDNRLLWGFNAGPNIMTPIGHQVFVNVVNYLIPD